MFSLQQMCTHTHEHRKMCTHMHTHVFTQVCSHVHAHIYVQYPKELPEKFT